MSAISYQKSTKNFENWKLELIYLNPILFWKNWLHKQSLSGPKKVVFVSNNKASTNAEVIPYEIGITGHGINCSANKSCDKVTDEGANDTKHSDFEITEKKKSIKHWIPAR